MTFDPNVHIISDPGLRLPIARFHPNIRDVVKRAYLVRGPTQLRGHTFPRENYGGFKAAWFDDYDWLEYSVSKNAAYCFYCFLFRIEAEHEKFGHEVFSKTGIAIGKTQQIEGSRIIARLFTVAITKLGSVLMTLKIKGQVCHEGLKAILYMLNINMMFV
jgi:hypothetical protein